MARRQIKDLDAYSFQLSARLDPSAGLFQRITASVRANPKRVVFAEGEEESVIRAAAAFQNSGLGKAILVGREEMIARRHPPCRHRGKHAGNPRAAFGAGGRSPMSRRSTSACSGAARSIAMPCAW